MHIKVERGTPHHSSRSLCLTCKKATIIRGDSLDQEIIECGELSSGHGLNRIRFAVRECNSFLDASHPSIREMEDIAWLLRTDGEKRQIGFVRMKDLTAEERSALKPTPSPKLPGIDREGYYD